MPTAARMVVAALLALCAGCDTTSMRKASAGPGGATRAGTAIPVRIVHDGDRYYLQRGGKPYVVKGAGIEFGDVATLAAHGGNSLRTWRTDNGVKTGRQVLDEAARLGVTVALCIEIGRERHGFDYDDAQAVARQLEYARGEVLKYKDHPALLAWIIGNEANLRMRNPRVFDAINDISRMIHQLDGNHPTTTALAGFSGELASLVATRAPDLDFLSIHMYGDIVNLPRYLAQASYNKPYFVTEWGAVGHWEVGKTSWGAPIEQNSSEKARSYLRSHEVAIATDPAHLIGSYVFLWGQKQERTPTWYGMFLPDGVSTEAVDVMHYLWNGAWPANRAPRIESMTLDSKTATQDVVLSPGARYVAHVATSDPDSDRLDLRWELMHESAATEDGGDTEAPPPHVEVPIERTANDSAFITAPAVPGAYRLLVYVYDGKGHAGHANIPFLVR